MGGGSSCVHHVMDEWSAAAANSRGIYSDDGLAYERFDLFCRLSVALQRSQAETVLTRGYLRLRSFRLSRLQTGSPLRWTPATLAPAAPLPYPPNVPGR